MHVIRSRAVRNLGGALCSIVAVFLIVLGCTEPSAPSPFVQPAPTSEAGRLVQQHCGGCHVSPAAAALDKQTWLDDVLPAMAPKLGINVLWGTEYYPNEGVSSASAVSFSDWMTIVDYYRQRAPDSLQMPAPAASRQMDLPLFEVRKPQRADARRPATTMVAVDPQARRIYTSDATAKTLTQWDAALTPTRIGPAGLIGVDARFTETASGDREVVITSIGTMRAVNASTGRVQAINLKADSSRVLAQGLPRPVSSVPADLNQDGRQDWVVCGFGHDTGALYALIQEPGGAFETHVIRNVPGAVDARVQDVNGDGWPDVVALFAHSDEGVWLFTNDKEGGFTSTNLLRFPPVYGSSSLDLVDFNDDGALDVLYTAGDNADYSSVLKPYHGVYVFMNRGDYRFEQAYFYHFNGATRAMAADFDQDGDLDIAAIGFFADLKEETARNFLYLERTGSMAFTPRLPPIQDLGQWISMDAADYDGDSDIDLILGNFARSYEEPEGGEMEGAAEAPFTVLENRLH